MSTGKIIAGVLGGVAVGAILGILFAPDKGSETRKKIAQKKNDAIDSIKEKFDNLLCSFSDKFDSIAEDANDLYKKGANKAGEIKDEVSAALS